MTTRLRHLGRILARLNDHRRRGAITQRQWFTLARHALAEYGRE